MRTLWTLTLGLLSAVAIAQSQTCPGDCDGSREIAIAEIIRAVTITLGGALSGCPAADSNADDAVSVSELIQAVNASLYGCFVTPPTKTHTHTHTRTSLPSLTPTPIGTRTPRLPTATRTTSVRCQPWDFLESDFSEFCVFSGAASPGCSNRSMPVLVTRVTTQSEFVILATGNASEARFLVGHIFHPWGATLFAYDSNLAFESPTRIDGVAGSNDDGATLLIRPADGSPTFSIDGCPFRSYSGDYVGLTSQPDGIPPFRAADEILAMPYLERIELERRLAQVRMEFPQR